MRPWCLHFIQQATRCSAKSFRLGLQLNAAEFTSPPQPAAGVRAASSAQWRYSAQGPCRVDRRCSPMLRGRGTWRPSKGQALKAQLALLFHVHPGNVITRTGLAGTKQVLTQVLQKSAATHYSSPSDAANPTILQRSVSQPSQRAMAKAMHWASHFLPFSAFSPYPLANPNTGLFQNSKLQGKGSDFRHTGIFG